MEEVVGENLQEFALNSDINKKLVTSKIGQSLTLCCHHDCGY